MALTGSAQTGSAQTGSAPGGDAAKQAWVARVLGVTVAPTNAGPRGAPGDFAAARAAWSSAIEQVDAQITALQAALRQSGDNDLKAIAEYGLNGVTGNHKVRLMAALQDIGAGPATPQAAKTAIGVIAPFRTHLGSDERVAVCDENPFGVAVAIRATLDPPLAALERALSQA
jgi:hypothetical protein